MTIDGKKKKVTKQRAVLMALVGKAIRGDVKATNVVLKLVGETLGYDPNTDQTKALSLDDQSILNSYLQQYQVEGATGDEPPGDHQEKPDIDPKAREKAEGTGKDKDNSDLNREIEK